MSAVKRIADAVMKRCTKCGKDLPADRQHFYLRAASKDGLDIYCQACRRAMNARTRARAKARGGGSLTRPSSGQVVTRGGPWGRCPPGTVAKEREALERQRRAAARLDAEVAALLHAQRLEVAGV